MRIFTNYGFRTIALASALFAGLARNNETNASVVTAPTTLNQIDQPQAANKNDELDKVISEISADFLLTPEGKEIAVRMASDLQTAGIKLHRNYVLILEDLHYSITKKLKENNKATDKERNEIAQIAVSALEPKITREIIELEALKKGAGPYIKEWLSHFMTLDNILDNFEQPISLLRKYIHGLVLQGETEVDDVLESFYFHGIKPNEKLIENLLKLHRYGGLLRISRLNHMRQDDKQTILEELVTECVRCFEDPAYRKNDKIAIVILPGVIDSTGNDIFSLWEGKIIEQISNAGYKIFPFEVHTDEQIEEALRRVYLVTGKKTDLISISGHGSANENDFVDGQGINLGDTHRIGAYHSIHPGKLFELMTEGILQEEFLNQLKKEPAGEPDKDEFLPPWNVINVANSKLTNDRKQFDTGDIDLTKRIKKYTKLTTVAVLDSCGSGFETRHRISLGRVFADNAGIRTYAAIDSQNEIEFCFNGSTLKTVNYFDLSPPLHRAQIETKVFPGLLDKVAFISFIHLP